MLKGKLTYTAIAVAALSSFGLVVTENEIASAYSFALQALEFVSLIVAVYGRWRATRG